jgi:hypothetical protein
LIRTSAGLVPMFPRITNVLSKANLIFDVHSGSVSADGY